MPQESSADCGAACLAMVLAHYGRRVPFEGLRALCGSGRDGASFDALASAASAHGLAFRAVELREPGLGALLQRPALLFWERRHFVVLEGWSARRVTLVDPAVGRRRLSHAEFAQGFSGQALLLEPGPEFVSTRGRRPAWLRQLRVALGERRRLAGLVSASLLLQAFGLALPAGTALLVDRVIPQRATSLFAALLLGLGAWLVAQAGVTLLRQRLLLSLQARLDRKLMASFFSHLLRLPYAFFQGRSSADLLLRLQGNATVRELLSGQLSSLLLDGLLVCAYLALLLHAQPVLAGIVVALALGQALLTALSVRSVRDLVQRDLLAQSATQAFTLQSLSGIAALKVAAAEARASQRFLELFEQQLATSLQRQRRSATWSALLVTLNAASPLVLLALGAAAVLEGRLSLGQMLGFNALAAAFLTPLGSLVQNAQMLQVVGAHLQRVQDVLDAPQEQPDPPQARPRLVGGLRFAGVSFRYGPHSPDVLQDVSFEAEPGELLAIVGPTGSGKSTLAKLIAGLYVPGRGRVFLDGVPLDELDLRAVRRQLGVVLQEPALFGATLRDNIALHDPDLPLEAVRRAARLALIDDEIARLPMGYETRLGEGGQGLSGGQGQRLCLARALAHAPRLLVLDEATSALDTETERQLQRNLQSLHCTRVVIAHRLSTVRQADRILVMQAGRIVEQGQHAQLLRLGGLYARLHGDAAQGPTHARPERASAFVDAPRGQPAAGHP